MPVYVDSCGVILIFTGVMSVGSWAERQKDCGGMHGGGENVVVSCFSATGGDVKWQTSVLLVKSKVCISLSQLRTPCWLLLM